MTITAEDTDMELRLAGSIRLGVLGPRGYGRTTLTEGESAYVVLSWGDAQAPASRGVFRQHYKTDELDASLLLLAILGFLPPDDDRIRATVLAIADELTQDGLVLRYKVEGTDTGFSGEEGTFTICSFWLVTALAMIGETERSHALCEKLLSFAGPLLLYAEEIDASTGQHLGNFPQAFTHLALIEAVSMLIETEQAEGVTR
jgi:alpha,alpha-trehalase